MRYHSREYVKYLQSPQWRERKLAFMKRHGAYCRACYRIDKLDCHHDDYARLGHEDDNDLWILCREHHQTAHRFYASGRYATLKAATWASVLAVRKHRKKVARRRKRVFALYQRGYCYLALGRLVV